MVTNLTAKSARLEKIRGLDTCTVSNAIERLKVRLRNEGFIAGSVRCRFPSLPPMVGYAVTGRIRSSRPPVSGRCYYDRMDFWNYLASMPEPRVLVLQDVDPAQGFGAFVGEIHATICQALHCVGYISNGSVRDLPAVRALGFQLFSGSVAVSHAYSHMVEFGEPVEIGGLKICPGDLMNGDRHGVLSVPARLVPELPQAAEEIEAKERELFTLIEDKDFSVERLAAILDRITKKERCL